MSPYRAILFDFDYTLADSSPGIIDCMNTAFAGLGLPSAEPDAIRRTIGMTLDDALGLLAGPQPPATRQRFIELFIARADEVMVARTRVYDAVPGVVRALTRAGLRLGIVSTKFRRRIEAVLARDGLAGAFDVIVGGEDVTAHKPAPDALLAALARLGLGPERVLYVGDSVADAETARRAAVPFAAVLSGVTERAAFGGYAPLGLFADLEAVVDWVAGTA